MACTLGKSSILGDFTGVEIEKVNKYRLLAYPKHPPNRRVFDTHTIGNQIPGSWTISRTLQRISRFTTLRRTFVKHKMVRSNHNVNIEKIKHTSKDFY